MASYSSRDISLIPNFSFGFVENYVKEKKFSSGQKLIDKGYKFFSEDYIRELKVAPSTDGCRITGRCYKLQKKNEAPYNVEVYMTEKDGEPKITGANCQCPAGLSQACGHITGLLYTIAHFKNKGLKALPEDVAKTSLPQTFHIPRGEQIPGKATQDVEVTGYSKVAGIECGVPTKTIKSTLYNPCRGDPVDWTEHYVKLKQAAPDMLLLPAIEDRVPTVQCKFGEVPFGSILSYQQKLHPECVLNIYDGVSFPALPLKNSMHNTFCTVLTKQQQTSLSGLELSLTDIHRFKRLTRDQSDSPLWHRLRRHRITASQTARVYKRVKDNETLVQQLKTKRHVTTAAMKYGLACEPRAAAEYSKSQNNQVNLYPSGVIVNFWAPWLAATPDRKVYYPSRTPQFGLLEIKCPQVSSVLEAKCLKKDPIGTLKLKRNHDYYYQVITQLAVAGLDWCDFVVWCENDIHCETIYFNQNTWNETKTKIDAFFFDYFL